MRFSGSGVLVIDKPEGITSHGVVQRVKKAIGARKCGHAGTLDPFATGVLVVMVNDATRLACYLTELDKRYRAVIKLGTETDTLDRTGKVLEERPVPGLFIDYIKKIAEKFVGVQFQTPPVFSAKRVDGVRLYKLARRGKTKQTLPKQVHIYSIEVLEWLSESNLLTIEVHCSKGTYVRVIARDLAKSLGTCGHLYRLTRLACGQFDLSKSIPLSFVGELSTPDELSKFLISPSKALSGFDEILISKRGVARLMDGGRLEEEDLVRLPLKLCDEAVYKALDETGELVALVRLNARDMSVGQPVVFRPVRVFMRLSSFAVGKIKN